MPSTSSGPLRRLIPAVLAVFVVLWSGCDEDSPTGSSGPTLAEVQERVFSPSCVVCHSGNAPAEGLDLSAGAAYDDLVNVSSSQVPDLARVAPGDPENSYLYIKITGDDRMADGTSRMPMGGALSDDEIALVRDWIEAGAPR